MLDRSRRASSRVNGAFAKAFRSEVQPVEIASALRREVDDRAAVVRPGPHAGAQHVRRGVGSGRSRAPRGVGGRALRRAQGGWTDQRRQQRYAFVGPVTVGFRAGRGSRHRRLPGPQPHQPVTRPAGHGRGQAELGWERALPGPTYGRPAFGRATTGLRTAGGSGDRWQRAARREPGDRDRPRSGRPISWSTTRAYPGGTPRSTCPAVGPAWSTSDRPTALFVDGARIGTAELADGSLITVGRTRILVRIGQW